MRYLWIRDRVHQGHFHVQWRRGDHNLADFFTKALPAKTHQALMPLLVHTPQSIGTRFQTAHARRAAAWAHDKATKAKLRGCVDIMQTGDFPFYVIHVKFERWNISRSSRKLTANYIPKLVA